MPSSVGMLRASKRQEKFGTGADYSYEPELVNSGVTVVSNRWCYLLTGSDETCETLAGNQY